MTARPEESSRLIERLVSGQSDLEPVHVGDTGARVFLTDRFAIKIHRSIAGFRRERDAWLRCPPELRAGVAEIVLADEANKAIVGTRVPGKVADILFDNANHSEDETDDDSALNCAAQAGTFLGRWHRAPACDADTLPLQESMHLRLEAALRSINHHLSTTAVRRVHDEHIAEGAEATRLAISAGSWGARVPCHRDYRPRNWIYDRQRQRLTVIDFEHARYDDPHVDLARSLAPLATVKDAPSVFVEAWAQLGHSLDPKRLEACQWLHAVQTLAWAARHGDPRYLREAERELNLGRAFDFERLATATGHPTRR